MSVLPISMGGQKVQAKIDKYFANSMLRAKSVTSQTEQNSDSLPDPMGDLKVKLNIQLDDDEHSNQAENQTPKHTPVKKQLGLIELN
jgi:hypothetical protein